MAVAAVRYGPGVTRELGMELADRGIRRALIVTDPVIAKLSPARAVVDSLDANGVQWVMYDRVRVEPTEESWRDAIDFARGPNVRRDRRRWRRFVDRHGEGREPLHEPSAGRLPRLRQQADREGPGGPRPGEAALRDPDDSWHCQRDDRRRHLRPDATAREDRYLESIAQAHARLSRSRITHGARRLRSRHPAVSTSCVMRSSRTPAIPFTDRPRPERPSARPPYQGANPISDVWSLQALRMVASHLVRAVEDPGDDEARASMVLAASFAGIGFGNAGVHLPHAMAYPVAGGVKQYRAPGYPDHALVPHGFSVILNAPAVFAFTGPASPRPTSRSRRGPGSRCVSMQEGRRGSRARRPHHLVHAATERAEWTWCRWLLVVRYSRPG